MKINEYSELASLTDDDLLLVWHTNTNSTQKLKLSTLKTYIGSTASPNAPPLITSPPTSGLIAWWEADYGVITDNTNNSTTVSSVLDKAATTNNDLVQTNKLRQPKLITNGLNDKPIFSFNGSSNYFYSNGASYAANLIISLFRVNNFNSYDGILSCRASGSYKAPPSNENINLTGIPGTLKIIGEGYEVFVDGQSVSAPNFNDYRTGVNLNSSGFHLVEQKINSISGNKYWIIGADTEGGTNSRFFNGDIAAILIYNINDDSTRLTARNYLKNKYNLTFNGLNG